jgi:hypothetical protein
MTFALLLWMKQLCYNSNTHTNTDQQAVNFPKWMEQTGNHPDSTHHGCQLAPFCKSAATYEQEEGICKMRWITLKKKKKTQ